MTNSIASIGGRPLCTSFTPQTSLVALLVDAYKNERGYLLETVLC
jgi:hypothetical protein